MVRVIERQDRGENCPAAIFTPRQQMSHWALWEGGHATIRFLEGFLEGSLKEVLLRRVLRRRLVRASVRTAVLRRGGCHRRHFEGAWKAETRPFAEYDPLRVHPG